MPINIEGGLLVDGKEVGSGGLTTYTATVSFTSDTDGLITYDVVPSDDEFLLSMTVNSNTAANTDLAGSTLNVVMHKSEISMTIEGETQTMLGYVGVLAVGDLSNKFDILVTLPVGTATSGIIQMKNSGKKYFHIISFRPGTPINAVDDIVTISFADDYGELYTTAALYEKYPNVYFPCTLSFRYGGNAVIGGSIIVESATKIAWEYLQLYYTAKEVDGKIQITQNVTKTTNEAMNFVTIGTLTQKIFEF